MPEVLWLLEHVRLRVDPLKDAAGSPFGKADRLYLYLHVQKFKRNTYIDIYIIYTENPMFN